MTTSNSGTPQGATGADQSATASTTSTAQQAGQAGPEAATGRVHWHHERESLSQAWRHDIGRDERAAILSWGAFTATFAGVRALTHWIRRGHGPRSGGLSLGGQHFHHYNLGIAGLTVLGALAVEAEARQRIGDHPVLPLSYGASTALIADEAALLLDLRDVYWARQGRESVEIATGMIGVGGLGVALTPLAQAYARRRSGSHGHR